MLFIDKRCCLDKVEIAATLTDSPEINLSLQVLRTRIVLIQLQFFITKERQLLLEISHFVISWRLFIKITLAFSDLIS